MDLGGAKAEPRAPAVSIGLPVFNGEKFLERALDSLLGQTFEDFEIVICDNASTDSTRFICEKYALSDARVRLFRNDVNIGAARNFNKVFELSKGQYFKWVSHDDWHAPESLAIGLAALRRHPTAVSCASGVAIVDENGRVTGHWAPPSDLLSPYPHVRLHALLWKMKEPHPTYGLHRSEYLAKTDLMGRYVGSDRTLLAQLIMLGPMVPLSETTHFFTVDKQRPPRRLSVYTDPSNPRQLPLRTWRLICHHLSVVRVSRITLRHKIFLWSTILRRFGSREFRRLVGEVYYSALILAGRVRAQVWRRPGR